MKKKVPILTELTVNTGRQMQLEEFSGIGSTESSLQYDFPVQTRMLIISMDPSHLGQFA